MITSAGLTAGRVGRLRGDLRSSAQRAPSEEAALLRAAGGALEAESMGSRAETNHRTVAADLLADLAAFVEILP